MKDLAISVRNLDKVFRIWNRPSDMLVEALTGKRRHTDFQALRNISFEVARGEVLGVMGRNGAGKSTLLRIIAGTLNATGGDVSVNGRVTAILELGTGFHPEYTGRENVFLGGLCLGLDRGEIAAKFDEIVAFSELADFIDQPFRTYSSGMQARLTFAVATAVDPDVLIIDEALAVGDARFALKSFDRVREFRRRGKSIIIVSHDVNQINTICDRAILLEKGRVLTEGSPADVGNFYHETLFGLREMDVASVERAPGPASVVLDTPLEPPDEAPEGTIQAAQRERREHRYGDGKGEVVDVHFETTEGNRVQRLKSLEDYRLVFTVRAYETLQDVCVGVLIRTPRGVEVFGTDSLIATPSRIVDIKAGQEVTFCARFKNNLAAGVYFATIGLARTDTIKHDLRFDALEFTVEPIEGVYLSSLANLEMEFSASTPSATRADAMATEV